MPSLLHPDTTTTTAMPLPYPKSTFLFLWAVVLALGLSSLLYVGVVDAAVLRRTRTKDIVMAPTGVKEEASNFDCGDACSKGGSSSSSSSGGDNAPTSASSVIRKKEESIVSDEELDSLRHILSNTPTLHLFEKLLESANLAVQFEDTDNHHRHYSDDNDSSTTFGVGDTKYTLFLPLDSAFEKLSLVSSFVGQEEESFSWLDRFQDPQWRHHLRRFVLHHLHRGAISLDYVQRETKVQIYMMDGEIVQLTMDESNPNLQHVVQVREAIKLMSATAESGAKNSAYTPATNGHAFMMDNILVPSFMEQTAFFVVPPSKAQKWIVYIYKAGLEDLVGHPGTAGTFLVPSNDVFAKLNPKLLAYWDTEEGKEDLRKMLRRHIIPDTLIASDSLSSSGGVAVVQTLHDGYPATFELIESTNSAHTIQTDVVAANGIVHIIDKLLSWRQGTGQVQIIKLDGATNAVTL